MTNEIDWQTADLNEAGEWVEVPAESLLPKWLLRSDEDEEIHFVVPYLEEEFCQWLMKKQGLEKETAPRYVQSYMSVYPDLDSRYEDDSLETLLSVLTYTKKDEAKNREPLHKIQIDGDFYTGTCSLRQALSLYLAFRQQGKAVPLHPVAKVDADT